MGTQGSQNQEIIKKERCNMQVTFEILRFRSKEAKSNRDTSSFSEKGGGYGW